MSESRNHIDLVQIAVKYIKSIIDPTYYSIIQYDSPDTKRPYKVIGNFIPDVYFWNSDQLIIGEAKTINDFDCPHSKAQFEAYIKECENFYGNSIIIISVPWQIVPKAKNYFRKLKIDKNIKTQVIIINEIGGCFTI